MSESIGTAALTLTVDTRGVDVGIEKSKSKVAGFSNAAQQEFQKLDAATKKSILSLDRQASQLGMTRAEWLAYNATLKTSGAIQQELLAKINTANAAIKKGGIEFNQYGLSAKQTTAALRQVPAQMTDIFVSLQGGQNPLTVLLQQGGQLKDVFGGVAPAAKALGAAVLGLINPVTLTIGAFIALGVAIKQGSDESNAFSRALALTGNAAGVTTSQLEAMATQIDETSNVTTHAAAAALATVAGTGKFTGDQIRLVAEAALQLQEATGRSIEKTVAEFTSLRDEPLDAILKLNGAIGDGTNVIKFLTPEQLRLIENLKEQGRTADAAAVAIRAYADAIGQRTPEVVRNLGTIETVWHVITQTAKEAWDEMLGIGRDQTVVERIHSLQEQIARATARGFDTGALEAQLDKARKAVESRAHPPPRGGNAASDTVDSAQAKAALELKDRYLTKEESKKRAIAELDRLKAFYTKEEFENLRKGIDERFKPAKGSGDGAARALANAEVKSGLQAYKDALAVEQAQIQSGTQLLQANYAARNVTAEDYYAKQRGFLEQGTAAEEKALQGQLAVLEQRNVKGKDAVDTVRQISEVEAQLAKVRAEGSTKLALLTIQEQEYYERRNNSIEDYRDRLMESNAALQLQTNAAIARIGLGSQEAQQQEQINAIYEDQARALADLSKEFRRGQIDQAQLDADTAALQEATNERVKIIADGYDRMLEAQSDWHNGVQKGFADWMQGASDTSTQIAGITSRALDTMTDALVEFATTGKLNFKALLASILSDIVKFLAKKAIMQFLQAFAGAALGSGGGGETGFGEGFTGLSGGPNALGNPYPGGTTLPTNAVLSKPTLFEFAKGGSFGVAGEAGPEAIMPLQRGANGKLGVRMYGGGGNYINVSVVTTINSDGSSNVKATSDNDDEKNYNRFATRLKATVHGEIRRSMTPGGDLYRAGVGATV